MRGELEATANRNNNNSNITCRASDDDPVPAVYSDTALLLIQGSVCFFFDQSGLCSLFILRFIS